MYLKFSSLSEISDSGVPVLSKEHTPVLHETMPNTKPEVKTKQTKIKSFLESKIKCRVGKKSLYTEQCVDIINHN